MKTRNSRVVTGHVCGAAKRSQPGLQRLLALVVPLLMSVAGCSSVSNTMQAAPSVLPAPPDTPQETDQYRIQDGDVLDIRTVLLPDLNDEVTVRPDGRISTSLISGVVARGKTVPELQQELFTEYQSDAKSLGFPEIGRLSVVVKTVSPMRIFVGGEVTTPGEIVSDIHDLTLAAALFRAGGVKPSGDEDKIFIIRNGPDGTPQYYMTSYHEVVTGKKSGANVPLAPFDIVIVPRSGITNVYLAFNQYVQQFVPISWGFSYIANQQYGTTAITSPAASVSH